MRAVRYHEHGGRDVLQVDDVDRPDPSAEELLIAVEAAAINPVDTYFREGSYEPASLPMIPGADFAGEVAAVGEGVEDFDEGDRVFGTGLGNDRQGTCAEFAVTPTDRVAHLPQGVEFRDGAALGVAGVTTFRALIDHAELEPAERCLVHGGSGGVGHAAVQIAAATGARVTTTASPKYHDRLADLGANDALDYGRDDLANAVTDVGEPSVILDHRLDDYLQFDADVAATGARVIGIGGNSPESGFSNTPGARSKELRIHLMSMFNAPSLRAVLERLAVLMDAGDLTAAVEEVYGLDEVGEGHRAVLEDSVFGKLVVEP